LQVAFYGLALNSSAILTSSLLTRAGIGEVIDPLELNTTLGVYKALHNVVIGSLVVSVAGLLPGYYATFFLIDVWGRKPIQFLGFAMLTVLLAILGKDIRPSGDSSVKFIASASDSWHLSWPYPGPPPSEQCRCVRCALLPGELLQQFRAQCDDVHHSGGDLSHALPLDGAWDRRCIGETWCHRVSNNLFQSAQLRQHAKGGVSNIRLFWL